MERNWMEFHVVMLEMIGLENIPIVELLTLYFLQLVISCLGNNACYAVEIGSHATGSGNVGGRI